ncbi:hypothetical protein BDW02DRAFT_584619 [Decorospora gaudefroyi]|uniref:Uncharacterized protein n=1 Tax=Decorospora gaudefroyi TaxID=184978 RepID=A0A6A5JXE9_9PLEO|nr:hypothetical protein BDW02DRAFT_584619 [Decorospora gaudefroyi]
MGSVLWLHARNLHHVNEPQKLGVLDLVKRLGINMLRTLVMAVAADHIERWLVVRVELERLEVVTDVANLDDASSHLDEVAGGGLALRIVAMRGVAVRDKANCVLSLVAVEESLLKLLLGLLVAIHAAEKTDDTSLTRVAGRKIEEYDVIVSKALLYEPYSLRNISRVRACYSKNSLKKSYCKAAIKRSSGKSNVVATCYPLEDYKEAGCYV